MTLGQESCRIFCESSRRNVVFFLSLQKCYCKFLGSFRPSQLVIHLFHLNVASNCLADGLIKKQTIRKPVLMVEWLLMFKMPHEKVLNWIYWKVFQFATDDWCMLFATNDFFVSTKVWKFRFLILKLHVDLCVRDKYQLG